MDTKQFALAMVTDLVNRRIIAKDINGTWTLTQPLLGYEGDVAFHSKDECIQKVTQAALSQYGQSQLKAAV